MSVPITEAMLYVMALWGVYLLFRVLQFPDISTDSVFSLGSIGGAFIFLEADSPTAGLVGAFLFGAIAGATTSILYSICHVPKLLYGVIMYAALFSINLKFFDRPNVSLPEGPSSLQMIGALDIVVLLGLTVLLVTNLGNSMVALGSNPLVLRELSAPTGLLLAIGMGLGNGLVACSGFVTSLYFGFSDVSLGTGVLVNSVAALIIGERLAIRLRRPYRCGVLFLGAIFYYGLVYLVVRYVSFGLLTYSDYKLVSGVIIVIVFLLSKGRKEDLIPLR